MLGPSDVSTTDPVPKEPSLRDGSRLVNRWGNVKKLNPKDRQGDRGQGRERKSEF